MNIEELTRTTTDEEFPSITITATSPTVAQMISLLEPGDMQLIFHRGEDKPNLCVKKISKSAKNIKMLLKVVDGLVYSIAPESRLSITTVEEYLRIV